MPPMAMADGIFFLVAGPSGAGKTTVLRKLLETSTGLCKDVSVTTRPPRPGEVDGRDYFFWDKARFEQAVASGEFLEHATVHGRDYYGTWRKRVEENLTKGLDVVKDIDVQGAEQVRLSWPFPRSVSIFLYPPGPEKLKERLEGRGTEDAERVARRLESAQKEIARAAEFDYLVRNCSLDEAVTDLQAIRRAEKSRRERALAVFRRDWPA